MGLRDKMREARDEVERQQVQAASIQESRPHSGVEYRVEQVRESLIGGKFSPDSLQGLLNRRAGEGWTLRQIIEADVKGRVGPGGVEGLLLVFERPVA
jgi:Domain of unknown function (DUF4177)